jgi:y4mF family transcriptional regulator
MVLAMVPSGNKVINLWSFLQYCSRTGTKIESPITTETLGELVRKRRKQLGLNQSELALASGTGRRFISDLENGKDGCELGKTLRVLSGLGLELIREPERKGGG